MTIPQSYSDRSRTETDWCCRRARYHGYEWEGRGLAPLVKPEPLAFGGAIADQLQKVKRGEPWVVPPLGGDEQLLAEALLYGYQRWVWPKWQQHFDLIGTEVEQPLQLNEWLVYNSRPDTLTRRKRDGVLCYGPEDKTTSWVDSLLTYRNNIQLHATAVATERVIGEAVGVCLVQGLYKGFSKDEGFGKRFYHPFVYAYRKEGRAGIVPDQWSAKYKPGWDRVPTTEFEGGLRGWIDAATPEMVQAVFPASEPVTPSRRLVEAYFKQLELRELTIRAWHEAGRPLGALDSLFPQNFSQCDEYGKSRKPCQWRELCYNPTAQKFPLQFFQKREPHHDNERTHHGLE